MQRLIQIRVLLVLVLLISFDCTGNKIPVLQNWRIPSDSEISDEWRNRDINKYLIIRGDFNGDGIIEVRKKRDGSLY